MARKVEPVYVGNKSTKEFHSVKRHKPECNFDAITADNRVEFKRGRDAIGAGFDACAHCAKHWKSRDNR